MSRTGKVEYFTGPKSAANVDWYGGPGWYWRDETGVYNGPSNTRAEADALMKSYEQWKGPVEK